MPITTHPCRFDPVAEGPQVVLLAATHILRSLSNVAVNFITDAPEIKAISFVGSDTAGAHVHQRGSSHGKRVQANLGAQNHAVVLEDTDRRVAMSALTGVCHDS